ncbi:MAG TPA: hypothetical protein PK253_17510 [Spirochaetota bacterium]|nr:hypothetical protein [Spirochaetota bacterium]
MEQQRKLIFGFYTTRVLAARIIAALLFSLGAGFLIYDDDALRKIKAVAEDRHEVTETVSSSGKVPVFSRPLEDMTGERIGLILGFFVILVLYEAGTLFLARFFDSLNRKLFEVSGKTAGSQKWPRSRKKGLRE